MPGGHTQVDPSEEGTRPLEESQIHLPPIRTKPSSVLQRTHTPNII